MRRLLSLGLAALVAAGAWYFWPSEARRVRARLDALAAVVNEQPTDGLGLVARTARLSKFFTEDVVVEPGKQAGPITGRDRLLALAARAPNQGAPFTLSFVDVSVQVAGADATARLTATLASRAGEGGEETIDAREAEVRFRNMDDWRISRVILIDVLEKPES